MSQKKDHSENEESFDVPEDEVSFEESNEDGEALGEKDPAGAIKKLREKLKACQAEKQEYLETSQRLKADYINLRKDTEKEKQEIAKFAKAGLLEELMDLSDTFELAFANREAWEKVDENWRRGVEYIYAKLTGIFDHHGLEVIDPAGKAFDPVEQHSIGTIETEKPEEDNRVLLVVQKGYKLNGRIIRPAKVKVGHKK